MKAMVLLVVLAWLPPTVESAPQNAATVEVARLRREVEKLQAQQSIALILIGDLARKIEQLQSQRPPVGIRYTESFDRLDGTVSPGRWEFFFGLPAATPNRE